MADAIAIFQKTCREEIRVGLTRFCGRELCDLRVFAEFDDGGPERKPTKSGISIRVEQLPELLAAVKATHEEAVRRGLIAAAAPEGE